MRYLPAIVLVAAFLLAACAPTSNTGRVVLGVTDAAADMGAVSSVEVTISSVRLHSTNDSWIEIPLEARSFDLLELKSQGAVALLADTQVPVGSYDQIRLEISDVTVTDEQGEQDAKLPSSELKLMGSLEVTANSTSTATFDFIADESLHVTGQGKYILAPVLQVETRSDAQAQTDADGHVRIDGGAVRTNERVGMGVDGVVGVGIRIPDDAAIDIDGGVVRISGKSNTSVNVGVNGGVNVTKKLGVY